MTAVTLLSCVIFQLCGAFLEEPPLYLKGNVAFENVFSNSDEKLRGGEGQCFPSGVVLLFSSHGEFPHRSRGFPAVKNDCLLFLPLATLAVQPVITCWLSFQTEGAAALLPVVRRHRLVALRVCVCAGTCLCSVFNRVLSQLCSELHD